MAGPSDIIRTVDDDELPASVRELNVSDDTLSDGLLMPHQKQWVQQCLDYPLNIAEKCRRSGITLATAWNDTVTAASQKRFGGDNIYYIGDTKEKGLEFIGYCAHFAKVMASAMAQDWNGIEVFLFEDQVLDSRGKVIETRQISSYRIRFASGFQIVALSSNPANIRGLQGIVNIDEAAFHKDVQAVIDASLALIIWGGRIRIISTHNGIGNPFNQLIQDSRKGQFKFQIFKITFDEVVANGLYKKVCLVKGLEYSKEAEQAWYDDVRGAYGSNTAAMGEELDVIPRDGSGNYMPRSIVEHAMVDGIPILRYAQPEVFVLNQNRLSITKNWIVDNLKPVIDNLPGQRSVLGQDFGRNGDLSVIWVLQDEGAGIWRTAFILELRTIPFDVQQQILFYCMDELPLLHHAKFDARGNGQSHAEAALQKYGPQRVECVQATAQFYSWAFPKYKAAYEDRSIVVPRSEDIIADHRRVVLDKGRPRMDDGRDKGSDGLYRHGDSAIAGLLAWLATFEEGEPPAGETVDYDKDTYLPRAMLNRKRAKLFRREAILLIKRILSRFKRLIDSVMHCHEKNMNHRPGYLRKVSSKVFAGSLFINCDQVGQYD